MLDCTELTFQQMADLVRAIRLELKRRNPIFVNAYTGALDYAIVALEEIHEGELKNPTCEEGPAEDKPSLPIWDGKASGGGTFERGE